MPQAVHHVAAATLDGFLAFLAWVEQAALLVAERAAEQLRSEVNDGTVGRLKCLDLVGVTITYRHKANTYLPVSTKFWCVDGDDLCVWGVVYLISSQWHCSPV